MSAENFVALIAGQAKANGTIESLRNVTMGRATEDILGLIATRNFSAVDKVVTEAKALCQDLDNPAFLKAFEFLKENSHRIPIHIRNAHHHHHPAPAPATLAEAEVIANGGDEDAMPVDTLPAVVGDLPPPSTPRPKRGRANSDSSKSPRDLDTSPPEPKRGKLDVVSNGKSTGNNNNNNNNNKKAEAVAGIAAISPLPHGISLEVIAGHAFASDDTAKARLLGGKDDQEKFANFVRSKEMPSLEALRAKASSINENKEGTFLRGERIYDVIDKLQNMPKDHSFLSTGNTSTLNYNETMAIIFMDYTYITPQMQANVGHLILALTTDYA